MRAKLTETYCPFNFREKKNPSPLDETAVQCVSDNTGNCLRCHTLRARPIHPRVSHWGTELTCGVMNRTRTVNTLQLHDLTPFDTLT